MGMYLGSTLVAPIITNLLPGQFNWMGENVQRISERFYSLDTTLDKTGYNTWTPSTTVTTIVASTTSHQFTADVKNYEYMLEWMYDYNFAYQNNNQRYSAPTRQIGTLYQIIQRRPDTTANLAAENFNHNYCTTFYTGATYIFYWTASGASNWSTNITYGVYLSAVASTLSSTSANSITVTVKTPSVVTRCNDSYFSTASAALVDKANSTIKFTGNIYKMDVGSCALRNMYAQSINIYNNPL